MMREQTKLYLVLACVGSLILSYAFSGGAAPAIPPLNPYYFDVLIGLGINVILAVSLDLVNGYTG